MIHVFQYLVKLPGISRKATQKRPHGSLRNVNVRKNSFIKVNGFLKSLQILKINPDFFADKGSFRNIKRRAERSYLNQTKRYMSNLSKTSPKKFWKKVNSFRKGKLSSSDRVSLEAFVDHFKHIL